MLLPALTIFLGAFLLFQLQPLMGKFILPWFGGGPGIWTTCLLFFQSLLLAGYAYAHFLTSRLTPRRQATVHLLLLGAALLLLPVMPGPGWQPEDSGAPALRILLLLAGTAGLPYFVLSATGPLVQRWFSLARPGVSPWRLYALSNAGSLIALVTFPFVFEPLATRTTLGWAWSAGLVVFAGLCGTLAWRVRHLPADTATVTTPEMDNEAIRHGDERRPYTGSTSLPAELETGTPVSGLQSPVSVTTPPASRISPPTSALPSPPAPILDRFFWFALPAIASLLLVAVTNKICLEIAAVPFLWVVPLAVYLLTFILCFDHPRWYSRTLWSALLVAGCGAIARCLADTSVALPVQVGVFVVTLLAAGMVCHGELYRLRPAAERLTGYYLLIAAGGAAGSLFVALGAPLLFADYREFQVGLVLALYFTGIICLLYRSRALAIGPALGFLAVTVIVPALQAETGRGVFAWFASWGAELGRFYPDNKLTIAACLVIVVSALRDGWTIGRGAWRPRMCAVPLLLCVLLGMVFVVQARNDSANVLAAARNFYGAYKVHLYNDDDLRGRCLALSHGGITHGLQFTHFEYKDWPTTYYGATSGVGRALDTVGGERRVGLIGLGAGTLATFGRPGDVFRFYEIDPAIVDVARRHFHYLQRTPATVEIALGDARLTLEAERRRGEPGNFHVLVLDAFSGDAIPVHLLTREAMALYLDHLRPDGVIAVHISNRHLDLRPVVEGLARHHHLHFATIEDSGGDDRWWIYDTTWVLLSRDAARLDVDDIRRVTQAKPDETARYVDWTDDHASLFEVLKW